MDYKLNTYQTGLLGRLAEGDQLIQHPNGRTFIHSSEPEVRMTEEVDGRTLAALTRRGLIVPEREEGGAMHYHLTEISEMLLRAGRQATDRVRERMRTRDDRDDDLWPVEDRWRGQRG